MKPKINLIIVLFIRILGIFFTVAGFRRLNRARIELFKGDDHAMKESRLQLRAQMEANRSVPTSGPVFEELVKGMDEAAHMLKHEIVRGNLNEDTGRYGRYFCFVSQRFCVSCLSNFPRHFALENSVSLFCSEIISSSSIENDVAITDVKIKREHVQGSDDPSGNIKPEIEPITEDTVRRMENPGDVQVCKSSSNNKN